MKPDFQREHALIQHGCRYIAGMDEAGRGPIAGPVAAAAVILDPARLPEGLDDSKRLTEAAREALHDVIMRDALAVSLALVPPAAIDEINILQATFRAMRRALAGLAIQPDHALIDGRDVPAGLVCPAEAIIGGDGLSASIAAASIIAKVSRDRLMRRLGHACPAYAFEVHKGYGTRLHREAVATHGVSVHHRMSFAPCKNGTG
jgi:ribonuclease HII